MTKSNPLLLGWINGTSSLFLRDSRGILLLILEHVEHSPRVGSEIDRDQSEDQRPDPSANRDPGGLDTTLVLDIVAPTFILPAHVESSRRA